MSKMLSVFHKISIFAAMAAIVVVTILLLSIPPEPSINETIIPDEYDTITPLSSIPPEPSIKVSNTTSVSLIIPSVEAQDANSAVMSDINNNLAIKLYKTLEPNPSKNIFFSPASIVHAMAIAYEGADGDTAKQFEDALGLSPDDDIRRHGFNTVITSLNADNAEYNISLANAVWLKHPFVPFDEYQQVVTTHYDGIIETFLTPESGNITINAWASNKTNGLIKEITNEDTLSNPDLLMIITNAIYFKGNWVTQFNESYTKPHSFWTSPQNEIQADTMFLHIVPFKYTDTDTVQILQMPYKGDRFSMLLILPNERDGLADVESSLTIDLLEQWINSMVKRDVIVSLPKFSITTDYGDTLKSSLQKLGIIDAFEGSIADFSKLSLLPGVFIDEIKQTAFVTVDEEGTEAAAVTSVLSSRESAGPPTFYVDHPFLFVIWDDETKSILFMGRIVDPTA